MWKHWKERPPPLDLAHHPLWQTSKVLRPWALFTRLQYWKIISSWGDQVHTQTVCIPGTPPFLSTPGTRIKCELPGNEILNYVAWNCNTLLRIHWVQEPRSNLKSVLSHTTKLTYGISPAFPMQPPSPHFLMFWQAMTHTVCTCTNSKLTSGFLPQKTLNLSKADLRAP